MKLVDYLKEKGTMTVKASRIEFWLYKACFYIVVIGSIVNCILAIIK